jgi:hypothetical protein
MRKYYCFLVLAILCSVNNSAFALDMSSTEILKIEGRVEVKKGPMEIFKKLHRNLRLAGSLKRLNSGDKVKTRQKSSAEMALKETCILAVKEQSLFEVPQSVGKKAMQELKAQQGSLLFKVVSGNDFKVKTADVIAGVKGTLFEMDIVDSFNTLIETPSLELGTIAAGGTMVNVYRGEVELTHRQTGKQRKLTAGQGVTAFAPSLLNLHPDLKEGFGQIRNFDAKDVLNKAFGSLGVELLNLEPNLSSMTNFSTTSSLNSVLGPQKARINNLFNGVSQQVKESIRIDELENGLDIVNDFTDEKFKFDFSKYRQINSSMNLNNRQFKEIYLGKQAFAACKADFGSQRLKLEPGIEGLSLIEGNGSFKVIRFNNKGKDLEFLTSYYETGNQRVTTVNVLKGELYGRLPGNIEYFKIPAGEVAFVCDAQKPQGIWTKAQRNSFTSQQKSYVFRVSEKFSKEREAVDKRNTKKKIKGVKKILNFKGFGF